MKDLLKTSVNHQGQLNPSSEVVPPNVTAKRRSKAEVAVEDSRARRFSDHSTDRPVKELRQMFDRHRGQRQLILLQDFPDPDALSSAWTYKLIAEKYDIHCEIVYAGALSHQENIALVKLTGLPLQRWTLETAKTKDLSLYQGCVFIDNQGTTCLLYQFFMRLHRI